MGASNVAVVYSNWASLTHRERSLLGYLALVTLDGASPPVYFGGWEAAARAIGLDPENNTDNAAEQFRRAISALVKAGAVVRSGAAYRGRREEFALTLDASTTAAPVGTTKNEYGRIVTEWEVIHRNKEATKQSPTEKVPLMPHLKGGQSPTEKVDKAPPKRCPLIQQRNTEEYGEEKITKVPTLTAPVDNHHKIENEESADETYRRAEAYLRDKPEEWLKALDKARGTLGNDVPIEQAVIQAAILAGWKPEPVRAA